jgi:predicted DNA-binding protein (MmcQ/YjbR family)
MPAPLRDELRAFAFGLPDAWEDHPWGESVAKIGKKVFVFFGTGEGSYGMGVKLPLSGPLALAQPGVSPSRYGLGAKGWVSIEFSDALPFEMLRDWIEESYRAVAPKKLVKSLG